MSEITKIDNSLLEFDDDAVSYSQADRIAPDISSSKEGKWRAFRTVKFDSERLKWSYPNTKKEKEEGILPPSEITRQQFVGVRGICLEFKYGSNRTDGEGATITNVCKTVRMEETFPDGTVKIVEDDHPLEFPFGQLYKAQKEPNVFSPTMTKYGVKLYGSRQGLNGEPNLDCQTCVENLMYMSNPGDFNSPVCRMDGYLIFCVMQLATVEDDLVARTSSLKWIDVADAGLITPKTVDGRENVPLDGPFILKITGLGKSQHWPIGKGQYENAIINNAASSYLPNGVMSIGDYHKYLHDANYYKERRRKLKDGTVVYPVVTEIILAERLDKKYSQYMPVFYPQNDVSVVKGKSGDLTINHWVKTALDIYEGEKTIAGVKDNSVRLIQNGSHTNYLASNPNSYSSNVPKLAETKTDTEVEGETVDAEVASEESFTAFKVATKK